MSLRQRRLRLWEPDDEEARVSTTFTQAVGGSFTFNGTLTEEATFLQAVAGSFTFNGTVGRVFIAAAGNVVNILQRLNRGSEN